MQNIIYTNRLILKVLDSSASSMLLDFVMEGKEDFEPFETLKDFRFYTKDFQKKLLNYEYSLICNNKYSRYYIFLKEAPHKIIGTVSFGFFTEFPFCSCNIGYKFLKEYHGHGYAKEACIYAINEIFQSLKFHQIFAYIMPSNTPSVNLALSLGFQNEGLFKKCLCIRGIWEDHYVYKLLNPFE